MTHRGPFQPRPFCDSVNCTSTEEQSLRAGAGQAPPAPEAPQPETANPRRLPGPGKRSKSSLGPQAVHSPQCPWEVYGHKQTSQAMSSSGKVERIFLIARMAGVSSASAAEPLSSCEKRNASARTAEGFPPAPPWQQFCPGDVFCTARPCNAGWCDHQRWRKAME